MVGDEGAADRIPEVARTIPSRGEQIVSPTNPRGRHAAPGPGRSARRGSTARRRRTRWLTGVLAAVTALGTPALLAPSASASFASFRTVDPATGFPSSYSDTDGLSLELCPGLPLCLSDTDLVAVHEAGGDAEAFSRAADASPGDLTARTRYTVVLTGGAGAIRDAAGNPLVTTSRSFTTGT